MPSPGPCGRLGGVVAIDGVLPPELGAAEQIYSEYLNYRRNKTVASAVPVLVLVGGKSLLM